MAGARSPATRPAWRDHDLIGVCDRRVLQLDLDTNHRMDPGSLRRADKADGAVQPAMIGDGESGHAQFDRSIDDLVRRGCAIEEREVGVAVELGVAGLSHESPGRAG